MQLSDPVAAGTSAAQIDWHDLSRAGQRYALIGIVIVMSVSFAYCYVYALIAGADTDLLQSLGWAMSDWAVWLVLAPIIARRMIELHAEARPVRDSLKLACCWIGSCLLLALAVRGGIDLLAGDASLALLLYKRLPIYLAVAFAVTTLAFWLARPSVTMITTAPTSCGTERRLAVQSGRGEHVLQLGAIISIEAFGNYLEVRAGGNTYLMRTTMKALEDQLAGTPLIRCHRSYFVNIARVVRLDHRPSGNHVLALDDGTAVPVSKAYRDAVRAEIARVAGSANSTLPPHSAPVG